MSWLLMMKLVVLQNCKVKCQYKYLLTTRVRVQQCLVGNKNVIVQSSTTLLGQTLDLQIKNHCPNKVRFSDCLMNIDCNNHNWPVIRDSPDYSSKSWLLHHISQIHTSHLHCIVPPYLSLLGNIETIKILLNHWKQITNPTQQVSTNTITAAST